MPSHAHRYIAAIAHLQPVAILQDLELFPASLADPGRCQGDETSLYNIEYIKYIRNVQPILCFYVFVGYLNLNINSMIESLCSRASSLTWGVRTFCAQGIGSLDGDLSLVWARTPFK